eukprot:tig00001214_g7558.t1
MELEMRSRDCAASGSGGAYVVDARGSPGSYPDLAAAWRAVEAAAERSRSVEITVREGKYTHKGRVRLKVQGREVVVRGEGRAVLQQAEEDAVALFVEGDGAAVTLRDLTVLGGVRFEGTKSSWRVEACAVSGDGEGNALRATGDGCAGSRLEVVRCRVSNSVGCAGIAFAAPEAKLRVAATEVARCETGIALGPHDPAAEITNCHIHACGVGLSFVRPCAARVERCALWAAPVRFTDAEEEDPDAECAPFVALDACTVPPAPAPPPPPPRPDPPPQMTPSARRACPAPAGPFSGPVLWRWGRAAGEAPRALLEALAGAFEAANPPEGRPAPALGGEGGGEAYPPPDVTFRVAAGPEEGASAFVGQAPPVVTLRAHSFLLLLASGYFRRMFGSGMREARTRVVEVTEYGADTLRAVLRFLYTGELEVEGDAGAGPDRPAPLLELLDAASYYELGALKEARAERAGCTALRDAALAAAAADTDAGTGADAKARAPTPAARRGRCRCLSPRS